MDDILKSALNSLIQTISSSEDIDVQELGDFVLDVLSSNGYDLSEEEVPEKVTYTFPSHSKVEFNKFVSSHKISPDKDEGLYKPNQSPEYAPSDLFMPIEKAPINPTESKDKESPTTNWWHALKPVAIHTSVKNHPEADNDEAEADQSVDEDLVALLKKHSGQAPQ